MSESICRYTFGENVPPEEVEASLVLAVMAAEHLHGETAVRLDAPYSWEPGERRCVIADDRLAGRDLNRIFLGFLRREFEPTSFDCVREEGGVAEIPAVGAGRECVCLGC